MKDLKEEMKKQHKSSNKWDSTHRSLNAEVLSEQCGDLLGSRGVKDDPGAGTRPAAHNQLEGPRAATLSLLYTTGERKIKHKLLMKIK